MSLSNPTEEEGQGAGEEEEGQGAEEEEEGGVCPICMFEFGDDDSNEDTEYIVSTNCGHKFHRECLLDWHKRICRKDTRHFTCPMCRTSILCNKIYLKEVMSNKQKNQLDLFDAIDNDDFEMVKSILKKDKTNINEICTIKKELHYYGFTPLIHTLRGGEFNEIRDKIAELLINELNELTDLTDLSIGTELSIETDLTKLNTGNELMKEIQHNNHNDINHTSLTMATVNGNVIIAEILINRLTGNDLNKYIDDYNTDTLLTYAIKRCGERNRKGIETNKLENIVKLLINKIDLDLNKSSVKNPNETPLILAIRNGKIEIAKHLIQQGAMVNREALKKITIKIKTIRDSVLKSKYNELKKIIEQKLPPNYAYVRQIYRRILEPKVSNVSLRVGGKKKTKKKKFKSKRKKTRYNR